MVVGSAPTNLNHDSLASTATMFWLGQNGRRDDFAIRCPNGLYNVNSIPVMGSSYLKQEIDDNEFPIDEGFWYISHELGMCEVKVRDRPSAHCCPWVLALFSSAHPMPATTEHLRQYHQMHKLWLGALVMTNRTFELSCCV